MRRNMEVVKKILEYAENNSIIYYKYLALIPKTAIDIADDLNINANELAYHFSILTKGGFLQDTSMLSSLPDGHPMEKLRAFPGSLTWEGHNLLDKLRSQD